MFGCMVVCGCHVCACACACASCSCDASQEPHPCWSSHCHLVRSGTRDQARPGDERTSPCLIVLCTCRAHGIVCVAVGTVSLVGGCSGCSASSQFYLTEADVGLPRADCVVSKLSKLNGYVTVRVLPDETLTEEALDAFNVRVVFCVLSAVLASHPHTRVNEWWCGRWSSSRAPRVRSVFGSTSTVATTPRLLGLWRPTCLVRAAGPLAILETSGL